MEAKDIVYMDNIPYMKGNIVMLPTNENTFNRGDIVLHTNDNTLFQATLSCTCYDIEKPQHLYITSNEEIKEGDYAYHKILGIGRIVILYGEECFQTIKLHPNDGSVTTPWKRNIPDIKKIIATTDKSLNLPLIPQSFIEKYIEEYNKDNTITEVLVEVEPDYNQLGESIWELKLNSQNEITIKQQKDSYTREEVIYILSKYADESGYLSSKEDCINFNNFIKRI